MPTALKKKHLKKLTRRVEKFMQAMGDTDPGPDDFPAFARTFVYQVLGPMIETIAQKSYDAGFDTGYEKHEMTMIIQALTDKPDKIITGSVSSKALAVDTPACGGGPIKGVHYQNDSDILPKAEGTGPENDPQWTLEVGKPYAILHFNEWYVVSLVSRKNFGLTAEQTMGQKWVWADTHRAIYVCDFGEQEQLIHLREDAPPYAIYRVDKPTKKTNRVR